VILVLMFFSSLAFYSRLAIWFPYIRTLIHCESSSPAVNRDSSSWSGSQHCHDKDLVARKAQSLLGIAMGLNSISQFSTIAGMGAAADSFGRKKIVLLYFSGTAAEALINWLTASKATVIIGRIIQGSTDAFHAMGISMLADIASPREVGLHF